MTALGVYLKYPQAGKVKTRLARTVGPERAAQAYSRMLDHILGSVLSVLPEDELRIVLLCDPFLPRERYQEYFRKYSYEIEMQTGADLGERLTATFRSLLAKNESAIVIGTDCVALEPSHLTEAIARLDLGADLVVGPALDGGYYLIGMTRLYPELFQGIAWSTSTVLAETLERAAALGLKVERLVALPDIDTEEDLAASGLAPDGIR